MRQFPGLFLIFAAVLQAQAPAAPAKIIEPAKLAPIRFSDTTLDNGLRVIISEDHYAPVYAIAVSYKVGSRDEKQGRTGFAHLFEHMMFKGSENVGPGEHFYTVFTRGGSMNGTTNTDRTLYYEIMPKNQLDVGLFLEADRMRSLKVTQENLDNQRQAVKEERRLGVDNQPYGGTGEKLDELIYDNFAYKHSVIGSMADLDAASVADVQQFFKTYYAPNNAVLALAGDLDTRETLAKVKKYFGAIPRQEPPKPADLTEPAKDGERRAAIDDKLARLTRLDIAYNIPASDDPDARAIAVGARIMGEGDSSRLYQKLVKDKELATSISTYVDRRGGPSSYHIVAIIRPGKSPAEVEGYISEEMAKFLSEPVTDAELAKTRASDRRSLVASRESVLSTAISLADEAAVFGDPGRVNTERDKRMAVTAAEIQSSAKKYFRNANRVVLVTNPAAAQASKPAAPVKQN